MSVSKRIQELLKENHTAEDIAEKLETTTKYVYRIARKYNLEIHNNKEKEDNVIKDLIEQGISIIEVSKMIGKTYHQVYITAVKLGLPTVFRNTKFNDINNINTTCKLNQEGKTVLEIANELNITEPTVRKYLKANKLNTNSKYTKSISNQDITLSNYQREMLLGSLLGDASISPTMRGGLYRPSFCQGIKQTDYFNFKCNIFGNLLGKSKLTSSYHKKTQKWYPKWSVKFLANPIYTEIYNSLYINGVKTITTDYLNNITPIGLAFWFMDDGSKSGTIATNCFTHDELKIIQNWFWEKYNIDTSICKDGSIYIKMNSRLRFEELIFPYMHSSMHYKLKKLDPNSVNCGKLLRESNTNLS